MYTLFYYAHTYFIFSAFMGVECCSIGINCMTKVLLQITICRGAMNRNNICETPLRTCESVICASSFSPYSTKSAPDKTLVPVANLGICSARLKTYDV